ncbi:MAG: hypothetical protein CL917_11870 [Deltaproteobacteria bacterium]|nr:hypothetical protein [Deltaproteobacteria bacterium]
MLLIRKWLRVTASLMPLLLLGSCGSDDTGSSKASIDIAKFWSIWNPVPGVEPQVNSAKGWNFSTAPSAGNEYMLLWSGQQDPQLSSVCSDCAQQGSVAYGRFLSIGNGRICTPDQTVGSSSTTNLNNQVSLKIRAEVQGKSVTGTMNGYLKRSRDKETCGNSAPPDPGNCYDIDFPVLSFYSYPVQISFSGEIEWEPVDSLVGYCAISATYTQVVFDGIDAGGETLPAPEVCQSEGTFKFYRSVMDPAPPPPIGSFPPFALNPSLGYNWQRIQMTEEECFKEN